MGIALGNFIYLYPCGAIARNLKFSVGKLLYSTQDHTFLGLYLYSIRGWDGLCQSIVQSVIGLFFGRFYYFDYLPHRGHLLGVLDGETFGWMQAGASLLILGIYLVTE